MNTKSNIGKQTILFGALIAAGLATEKRGISVIALNVVPHDKLTIDANGLTVHSGMASGGQEVHSVKSKIDTAGGKSTVTLQLGNGGKISMFTADAEVAFAQLLPTLAKANLGAGIGS